jgi:hypothetical protein
MLLPALLGAQEQVYRPPIDLQIPQVRADFSDADLFEVPDQTPAKLIVRVRRPLAENVNRITLRLNGQAVTYATTVSEGAEGKLAELNLRLREAVKLQRGSNSLEAQVVDKRGRRYYRGFVIRTREASRSRYFAYEGRPGSPEVEVLEPAGPIVFLGKEPSLKQTVRLRVQCPDANLATVRVNGQLQQAAGAEARVEQAALVTRAQHTLVVEASTTEGLKTIVTIPVNLARPEKALPFTGGRYALLIGLGRYAQAGAAGAGNLDASALAEALERQAGFPKQNIRTLVDEQATRDQIRAALETFLAQPKPEDLVVVLFAGHGLHDASDPDQVYLATWDTQPGNWKSTALPLEELERTLGTTLRTRQTVLLFDVTRPLPPNWPAPDLNLINGRLAGMFPNDSTKATLVGSGIGEMATETEARRGSFTAALVQGLLGAADLNRDGSVSTDELFDYARVRVDADSAGRQHPFYRKLPAAIALTGSGTGR